MINVAILSSSNCFSCVSVAQHSGAIRPLPYFSVCFMKAIDLQLLQDPAHPSPSQALLSAVTRDRCCPGQAHTPARVWLY